MANPEKLNLWDRVFNRYKKTIHKQGSENWDSFRRGIITHSYSRDFVEYLIIDRITGSETIEKVYLN